MRKRQYVIVGKRPPARGASPGPPPEPVDLDSLAWELFRTRRREMIAEAAYFRAQRHGSPGGDPARDWAEAEAEIDAMLRRRVHERER